MESRKSLARPSEEEEDQSDSAPGDSRSSQHHGEQRFSPPQQEKEYQQIPPSDLSHKQYSKRQARSSPHNQPRISPGHQNPLIYGYPQRYGPQQYGPPQLISARSAANAVTPDTRNFMPPNMLSPPNLSTRKRTVLTPGSAMSTTSLSPSKTGRNQGMCYIHAIYIHIEAFFFGLSFFRCNVFMTSIMYTLIQLYGDPYRISRPLFVKLIGGYQWTISQSSWLSTPLYLPV